MNRILGVIDPTLSPPSFPSEPRKQAREVGEVESLPINNDPRVSSLSLVLCCAFSNGLGTAPHWLSSPGQLFLEVGLSSKSKSLDLTQVLSRLPG